MRYRKQDEDNDYVLGTGKDFYVDEPAAVAQSVRTRLELATGEWFLDSEEGTAYDDVLGSHTQNSRDIVLRDRALGTPGVNEITGYSSSVDRKTREFQVQINLDTIYGQTTVSTVI
jgi:hypothetical protein